MAQSTTESDIRADLVRRLFAVAISIGVGSTIVGADWVKHPRIPSTVEFQQISIVILSLYATVLSWDGYLMSITKKPLYDRLRFSIDVTLVFTYMFLIATSGTGVFWLPTFCIIFFLYFIWDILTIRMFPAAYDFQSGKETRSTVVSVYFLSFFDSQRFDRGPIATLIWGLYFLSIYFLSAKYPNFGVFPACLFAFLGINQYRMDKRQNKEGLRGFSSLRRLLTAGGLFSAAAWWGCHTAS